MDGRQPSFLSNFLHLGWAGLCNLNLFNIADSIVNYPSVYPSSQKSRQWYTALFCLLPWLCYAGQCLTMVAYLNKDNRRMQYKNRVEKRIVQWLKIVALKETRDYADGKWVDLYRGKKFVNSAGKLSNPGRVLLSPVLLLSFIHTEGGSDPKEVRSFVKDARLKLPTKSGKLKTNKANLVQI